MRALRSTTVVTIVIGVVVDVVAFGARAQECKVDDDAGEDAEQW